MRHAHALALLLVASVVAAQEPPRPEATPDASELLDGLLGGLLGFRELSESELQKEVEEAGGVPFRQDVRVDFMGRAELGRFLKQLFDAEYPEARARLDERTLVAFDLLPAGENLRALRARVLQENIAGFYDERPGQKRLYAVSEDRRFGPMNQIILSHELRHALQDQYVDLRAQVAESVSDYDDRRLAWLSLLEGDATLLMERFVLRRLPGGGEGADTSGLPLPGTPEVPGAPPVVRDQLVLPYVVGREFAHAIWAQGGAQALRAAWDRPPRSTEQVLHPEKYFAGEEPRPVEMPATLAGTTLLTEGVLGEIFLRTLLEGATEAAAGWGGDSYRVFDTGAGTLLVWRAVWDRPDDAREFLSALGARFATHHGPGRTRGGFTEYKQGPWRYATGVHGGATVFVSSDDPRSFEAGLALFGGAADPDPDRAAIADSAVTPPDADFVDKPAPPLDNAGTESAIAGSAGERLSPVPQGGAMASSPPGQTNLGMDPRVAGLLCYVPCCVGLVFSVVVAVVEKQSRYLRFHAFQSLLLHAAGIVVMLVLSFLQIVLNLVGLGAVSVLVWLVQMVVLVAMMAVLVILLIKANAGEEFPLPVIGEMARKWV